jgi:hypothetical protein
LVDRGEEIPIAGKMTIDQDSREAALMRDLARSRTCAAVLQTLFPLEPAALVLREVFAEPYPAVAETLGSAARPLHWEAANCTSSDEARR